MSFLFGKRKKVKCSPGVKQKGNLILPQTSQASANWWHMENLSSSDLKYYLQQWGHRQPALFLVNSSHCDCKCPPTGLLFFHPPRKYHQLLSAQFPLHADNVAEKQRKLFFLFIDVERKILDWRRQSCCAPLNSKKRLFLDKMLPLVFLSVFLHGSQEGKLITQSLLEV